MIPLTPGQIFHIYNRANGKENLFVNEGNYHFFLDKIALHLPPVCKIYAWCLMPNHFHLLAKIKDEPELQLLESFKLFKSSPEKFVSKQFSNLFSSYTQAFNKQQNRHGSLFSPNFKRKLVTDRQQFINTLRYVHFNPVHHGFVTNLDDWKFYYFHSYISTHTTKIERDTVLRLFGNMEEFIKCHSFKPDMNEFLEME